MSVKDLRPALVAFLYGDSTISTLVGGGVTKANGGRRIDPIRVRQGITAASLVYNTISGIGDHHNEGPSGLGTERIQIAAWAATPDEAQALARAVKNRLDGYRGAMGSGADEVAVEGVFFDTWRDQEDQTAKLFGKTADYIFKYDER